MQNDNPDFYNDEGFTCKRENSLIFLRNYFAEDINEQFQIDYFDLTEATLRSYHTGIMRKHSNYRHRFLDLYNYKKPRSKNAIYYRSFVAMNAFHNSRRNDVIILRSWMRQNDMCYVSPRLWIKKQKTLCVKLIISYCFMYASELEKFPMLVGLSNRSVKTRVITTCNLNLTRDTCLLILHWEKRIQ